MLVRCCNLFFNILTFRTQLDLKRRDADPDVAGMVDEEEFAIVKSMKEKKKMYRDSFEELKQIKSEVEYLNRLVDQCRSKLVRRTASVLPLPCFSGWCRRYSTLSNGLQVRTRLRRTSRARPLSVPTARLWMTEKSEAFELQQMERVIAEDPESLAFHNARKVLAATKVIQFLLNVTLLLSCSLIAGQGGAASKTKRK